MSEKGRSGVEKKEQPHQKDLRKSLQDEYLIGNQSKNHEKYKRTKKRKDAIPAKLPSKRSNMFERCH